MAATRISSQMLVGMLIEVRVIGVSGIVFGCVVSVATQEL